MLRGNRSEQAIPREMFKISQPDFENIDCSSRVVHFCLGEEFLFELREGFRLSFRLKQVLEFFEFLEGILFQGSPGRFPSSTSLFSVQDIPEAVERLKSER